MVGEFWGHGSGLAGILATPRLMKNAYLSILNVELLGHPRLCSRCCLLAAGLCLVLIEDRLSNDANQSMVAGCSHGDCIGF